MSIGLIQKKIGTRFNSVANPTYITNNIEYINSTPSVLDTPFTTFDAGKDKMESIKLNLSLFKINIPLSTEIQINKVQKPEPLPAAKPKQTEEP